MKAEFQTTNTDLAAYLYARAYPLLGMEHIGERAVFTFPAEAALSAEAFYAGATIVAKNLLHAAHILQSTTARV